MSQTPAKEISFRQPAISFKKQESPSIFSFNHWLHKAPYWHILVAWIVLMILSAAMFFLFSSINGHKVIVSGLGDASSRSILQESAVFAFANSLLLGWSNLTSAGLVRVGVVAELFLSLLLYGLLVSRLFAQTLNLWPSMFDNAKNKKVHTIALMFSIYRHDIDAIIHKLSIVKSAGPSVPKHIAKDLEAASEEFYLGLLEVEMFLNPAHTKKAASHHVMLLLHNVNASLEKMKELLQVMAHQKIKYASKTFVFNLKYSLELTEKIGEHYKALGKSYGPRVDETIEAINALRKELIDVL